MSIRQVLEYMDELIKEGNLPKKGSKKENHEKASECSIWALCHKCGTFTHIKNKKCEGCNSSLVR